jgi:hypothetical protein
MKILSRTIVSLVIFVFGLGTALAQSKNQSIGFQVNPYFDSQFFHGFSIKPVYAVRYSFKMMDHISFGPEVSGYYMKLISNNADLLISNINLGAYVRYSVLPKSRINPFVEISPYYSFHHFKSKTIVTPEGIGKEYRDNYLTGYISPGFSLVSKSKRFSLDLFYKFSNKTFVNGNKSAFTYRLNFNF